MMVLLKKNPGLRDLLPGVAGFFLGRFIVLEFVSPLAVAFAAVYCGSGFYISAILTFFGVASGLDRVYIIRYAPAFAVLAILNYLIKPRLGGALSRAYAAGGAMLFSGLAFAAIRGMSAYFTVAAVIESAFAFCAAIVLQRANLRRARALTGEEQISLGLLAGAVVVGAADIHILLGWVFLGALLMLVAQKSGAAAGGSAGMLLGIALSVNGHGGDMPVVLGAAAFAAGALRGKLKIRAAAGFITGLAASTLYTAVPPRLDVFAATAVAAAVYMLAPQNFYFDMHSTGGGEYLRRARIILSQRLYGFSESFDKLSRTFSALAKPETGIGKNDYSGLIEDISENACGGCGMYNFCWRDNFRETYRAVLDTLNSCAEKSRMEYADIPKDFRAGCINSRRFADAAGRIFEIYKINMSWRNRVVESRSLISEQLSGVARLIQSLAGELDLFMNFKTDLEDGIYEELQNSGIEVSQVIVLENKLGKYEVSIRPKACPGRGACAKGLSRIVSGVLGRRMLADDSRCTYDNGCSMRLVEEQKFRISSGIARRAKTGSAVSGDNYSFMELRNGQCLLALSDGMGSGERAHEESAAAVELLEDFIESGFDKDLAVKLINSVLVLKSDEDSFSTLDICSVDLHTGYAEFIKIGAAATFLLRDKEVQIVKSSTLPIGILDTVDIEVSGKVLKENDIIVMATDGLTETDGGEWIDSALRGFSGRNPQDIADHLIKAAEGITKGYFRDDCTVLAARVWRRSY